MDLGRENAIIQLIIYSRHKSFETVTTFSIYKALYMQDTCIYKAQMVMLMPKMFELLIINNKQGNRIAGRGGPAFIHRSSTDFIPRKTLLRFLPAFCRSQLSFQSCAKK